MIPIIDRRRDVLASLSLILAAAGLDCAQTELGKKQLYRMIVTGHSSPFRSVDFLCDTLCALKY
jgi:hypothetical protein